MKVDPGLLSLVSEFKEPGPVPYTVRIGITGQRNLDNPEAISAAVQKLLIKINQSLQSGMADLHQPQIDGKSKWQVVENRLAWNIKRMLALAGILPKLTKPDRHTPIEWKVVSSLAKGADRIVARSAMDYLNASLEVVLPFSVEDYRKDFNNTTDLDEFNELFARASNNNISEQSFSGKFKSREEGYEHAGIEVADSCEILLAVWDGQPARGKGGTAEIVKYACSVNRLVVWINALNPGLPPVILINIQNTVDDSGNITSGNFQVSSLPLPKYAAGWSSRYLQVAEYNRDSAFRKKEFDEIVAGNLLKLEKARQDSSLLPEKIIPIINILLPHYTRADFLAIHYQKLHIRSATWLYRLSAIAVAIAVFQILYFPAQTAWVLLEILALVGAVLWYRIGSLQHWHDKWLNYRHLAERIRILLFHTLVNEPSSAQTTQKQQLPFYPGPGGWVLNVFDRIRQDLPALNIHREKITEVKKFIISGWINDQAEYHKENAISKNMLTRKDHLLIGAMLATTLLAAILHLLKVVHNPLLENFIIAIVIILPAFAAAQHAISVIHDYERIAARSARMNEILLSLQSNINLANSREELSFELQRAEDIMSAENHEWCVSLSFRRISLPV